MPAPASTRGTPTPTPTPAPIFVESEFGGGGGEGVGAGGGADEGVVVSVVARLDELAFGREGAEEVGVAELVGIVGAAV